jgi:hypothetical protein
MNNHGEHGEHGDVKKAAKHKRGRKKGSASNPGAHVPGMKRGARSAGTVPIRAGGKRSDRDENGWGRLGLLAKEIDAACEVWLQARGIRRKNFHFGTY